MICGDFMTNIAFNFSKLHQDQVTFAATFKLFRENSQGRLKPWNARNPRVYEWWLAYPVNETGGVDKSNMIPMYPSDVFALFAKDKIGKTGVICGTWKVDKRGRLCLKPVEKPPAEETEEKTEKQVGELS